MSSVPLNSGGLGRKVSLIRPERRRYDENDPQYHYRMHAQNMEVIPSTTGNDPMLEDGEVDTLSSEELEYKSLHPNTESNNEKPRSKDLRREQSRKLQRKATAKDGAAVATSQAQQRKKTSDANQPPSLWNTYCQLVTFWCPNFILKCFGMPQKAEQRAWREKMGLISLIILICGFVGFLTFGFTQVVCPNGGPLRLRVNEVGPGYMIFHGQAYDLTRSRHPYARGIADGGNVLWDFDDGKHGGQDGSFLFQNVNGACKNLITLKANSGVPSSGSDVGWYFPCHTFNQDGSSKPNTTYPYYFGWACHTSKTARESFYDLRSSGDVYFTWQDIKNTSRNLMVYNGDVLDLDLLEWFNSTQVSYPSRFDQIRTNPNVRGIDVTYSFSTTSDKAIAECFQDIIKVGSIDTETVGCIASKVVLYVSLIFILSIVLAKFVLALIFQWFLCHKYAADKTPRGVDSKQRKAEIEDWADDIYRAPPKLTDINTGLTDKSNKRGSFLPTTSRFTSPYAIERITAKNRPAPTTMASQSSTSRLVPGGMYGQSNRSETGFGGEDSRASLVSPHMTEKRYSSVMGSEGPGPQGFINEAVVPQPPPEWQPFGYPLAHTICLVTAYSEGPEGVRTTLDSIATTDYPNSHKLIFIVCDGIIKGHGETMTTPEVCLSMMKDHTVLPDEVQPYSYVAVSSGSKRHNMAKIYSGFYDYGEDSRIPVEKQQRVPMLVVVKCGTAEEAHKSKPGNRGKRDSQIILMSFLQKVMFDERMTELEYEMFNGIYKITGMSPDFYEIVLMVDADTKVFPDCLTHMISAMVKDPEIMGLCGETKIANKRESWVSMIQVFEYFISHHLSKSFESVFGGVTCLPGCFCMYRIKAPKGGQNYWVPILANPDVVEHYSENVVDTLHKKNLLLLGEDRYLSTLMLRTFPKRKQVFVPQAVCKTTVPEKFSVLLSQRRRWINSTVHNLMELVLVRDLCGTFCFSMQFVVFIELVGTLVLPAAISFTIYLIVKAILSAVQHTTAPVIPLVLLAMILGLPAVLIVVTAHRVSYVMWMLVYLLSLPIWNFVLPAYAYWKFDDFSWGDTRRTAGETGKGGHDDPDGEFDSSKITMKRWADFEHDRRMKQTVYTGGQQGYSSQASFEHKGRGVSTYEGYDY
ncbi:glycosyltransferase family 2 protein [Myriangium duriaei CBS 260.36]|uniref:chitin synthase n=1 Tax=Myriangium duriaei CBS 260.36 TaxID=1168546 RepID=A0A9P4J612_9PEZI|nr:glycosyltransferase family 2 protein [Myriangium duriaei CBS 260.36]